MNNVLTFSPKGYNRHHRQWNWWSTTTPDMSTLNGLKIKLSTLLSLILVLLFSVPIAAQDSLSAYLEIAAQNNPKVKASFNQYLAALEKVPQVGALPDPQASFGFFLKPMAILGGNQVANVQVMQMFPWFGTLQTAKDEASEMAKAKLEEFNEAKANLFYEVKSNAWQLMKLDLEIELVQENIEMLESLEKLVLVKFESPSSGAGTSSLSASMNSTSGGNMNGATKSMAGMNSNQQTVQTKPTMQSNPMGEEMSGKQTGLQDVLRVKMEILDHKNRLATLQDQKLTAEIGFNALLNRDVNIPVHFSDSLVPTSMPSDKKAIADSILNNNPMLAMLASEANSYALMEQKAKKMGLPMVGVGVNYMINQKREDNTFMMNGNDMVMPMLSVSIPIYRKKYNAMQREAQLMQETSQQQAVEMKNNLLVEHRNIVQNLNDAERRITLYQEQEVLARRTSDLLLSEFSTTGADYEELLRVQYKILDYGFKRIEAIVDYNTAVAEAEQLMNLMPY